MNTNTETRLKTPTVLIVDDTPSNVAVLAEYLGSHGVAVMVAQDGEEGVARAEFGQPDLILLDVMMPGVGGFEACRRLKSSEKTCDIPVIFMTALSDIGDKISGYRVGGVDYVTKPFQAEEVLARVNTHLTLRAARQQLIAQNLQLQQEIVVRQRAEAALQQAYEGMEERVAERTAELACVNASLKAENIERKRAEEALRKSEELWRDIFENNPTMYFMIDAAGTVVSVNPFGAEQLGYTVAELVGHSVLNVFHDADRQRAQENVGLCLEQLGRTMSWEIRKVRKDGSMLWVRETAKAVARRPGHPIVLIVCEDITERKEAQDKLQSSEAFLVEGQRISHTGSWSWNIPTGKLIWSEEHCRIFGFDPKEVEPTFSRFMERVHPEDRSFVQQILDAAVRERSDFSCEFRILLPDGTLKHVHGVGRPLAKESGDIEDYNGTTMDITARKRVEEALREREARIRRLVDSNIIGVFFWNLRGGMTDANDAFLQITGYARQDLLSGHLDWIRMTPPEYRAVDAQAIEELGRSGKTARYEKEFIRKDGSRVPILLGAALLEGSQENGVAFVLDLTIRKRAEEALRKAHNELERRVLERTSELKESNQRLEIEVAERKQAEAILAERSRELARSNAELEQLAYVASHDLQEPLRMVASYLQLLSQRYKHRLDTDADEFIGFAVDGAKRMQALIEDLLEYSRVGTKTKPAQPTSSAEALERALDALHLSITESGARIRHDALPMVIGDALQLTQLFQNLIGNAIKFRSDQPPEIRIRAEPEAGFWRFSLQDNGIGIDPEYFDRIFVMFQRLHGRRAYSGTGIGLAICKKIVERHGGHIWVEPAPGAGSVFKFTLPRAIEVADAAER